MPGETSSASELRSAAEFPAHAVGFDAEALAQRVHADLSALFAGLGRGAQAETRPWWLQVSHRARRHAQSLGALVAVGLVGVAAGTMLKGGEPSPDSRTAVIGTPQPQLETTRWLSPIAAAVRPTAAVTPEAAPRSVLTPKPSRPKAATRRCRSSRCEWHALMAADRRLRRSYERAVQAGVSRRVLAAYRDDWSDARKRARRSPADTAAAFARLTARLDRETRRIDGALRRYASRE